MSVVTSAGTTMDPRSERTSVSSPVDDAVLVLRRRDGSARCTGRRPANPRTLCSGEFIENLPRRPTRVIPIGGSLASRSTARGRSSSTSVGASSTTPVGPAASTSSTWRERAKVDPCGMRRRTSTLRSPGRRPYIPVRPSAEPHVQQGIGVIVGDGARGPLRRRRCRTGVRCARPSRSSRRSPRASRRSASGPFLPAVR